jgi:uncharacterized protein YbjT (DUF2867 family)
MRNAKLKVLVYGATGSQSSPVVMELLRRGHHAIAVTHSPEKAKLLKNAGAEIAAANFNDENRLRKISLGVDAVSLLIPFFLPSPVEGASYAKNAIQAAKAANVKYIAWNASGVIPVVKTGNPALDVRIEIAQLLKESGIPYVIFQPSVYAENLLGPWTAPFVKVKNQLAYPVPEHIPMGWIASHDVAALIVAAIENPSLAGNQFLISGVVGLKGSELAKEFSRALNRTITYYPMPPVDFGQVLDATFGQGAGDSAAKEYQKMWDTSQFPSTHFPMETVLKLLPVKMTSMVEWVRQNAKAF